MKILYLVVEMRGRHFFVIICLLLAFGQLSGQGYGTYHDLESAMDEPQRVIHLDLSNSRLTHLPDDFNKFIYLESLDVSNNNLKALPSCLTSMRFLRHLNLEGNSSIQSSELFELLEKMVTLRTLNINDCGLRYIGAGLVNLALLVELEIRGNNLESLPQSLSRLKSLAKIDVSNNNLTSVKPGYFIPRTVTNLNISDNPNLLVQKSLIELTSLFELDTLVVQGIKDIPYELMLLDQISHLDLSDGRFNTLPDKAKSWKNLKSIRLQNCERVSWSDFLEKLALARNLEEISIGSNRLVQLPLGIAENKRLSKVEFTGNKIQLLPPDIGRLKRLKELVLNETPALSLDKVFEQLSGNTVLQTLRIKNGGYEVLPANLHLLKGLKKLDLKGNLFDKSLIELCENILYGCLIEADEFNDQVTEQEPNRFDFDKSWITKMVPNPTGTKFTTPAGSIVIVPDSSFYSPVRGFIDDNIQFKFIETSNPVEGYLSGFFDQALSSDESAFVQYAGLFKIAAYHDGEELLLGPGKKIGVEWGSKDGHMNLNLWQLDNQEVTAKKIGRDELVLKVSKIKKDPSQDFAGLANFPESPIEPAPLKLENIKFSIKNRKNSFTFAIESISPKGNAEFVNLKDHPVKRYPEMKSLQSISWKYDGANEDDDLQKAEFIAGASPKSDFTEIFPESEPFDSYYIQDFTITPDRENDNYLITLVTAAGTTQLSAYPIFDGKDLSSSDPKTDQKLNKYFYRDYSASLKERKIEWMKMDSIHLFQNENFISKMQKFRNDMDRFSGMVAPGAGIENQNSNPHRRKTRLPELASFLVGKERTVIGEGFSMLFIDENGDKVDPVRVVVFDATNNLVYKTTGNNTQIDPAANISMLAYLDDKKIGIINQNQFRRLKPDPALGKLVITLNVLTEPEVNSNRMSAMYNIR